MGIVENRTKILKLIESACKRAGRDPADIKLLVVTKTRSIAEMEEAIGDGIKIIGENKVQEAEAKLPFLKEEYDQFHFIGHLQSNKVNKLLRLKPDLIHSIDSLSTLKKINNRAARIGTKINVLIEVNTSGEESKFGIQPEVAEQFIRAASEFTDTRILGLMTIGLFTKEESLIRACFKKLKELFEDLKALDQANCQMKYLSMGMTNDYQIAVEEGANIVRIGTAIFGPRKY